MDRNGWSCIRSYISLIFRFFWHNLSSSFMEKLKHHVLSNSELEIKIDHAQKDNVQLA